MKCRYSENDIALFVERDIAPVKAREIEDHLSICEVCRELAEELRETQSAFKSLRRDTVSLGALLSVRTKVLAEVGARSVRPVWGRWVYALAGVAFVAVMAIGVVEQVRKPGTPQLKQFVKSDPLQPASRPAVPVRKGDSGISFSSPAPKSKAKTNVPLEKGGGGRRPQGAAQAEVSTEPPRQLVVKLLTDDPNIVIYWLVDQKGGTL